MHRRLQLGPRLQVNYDFHENLTSRDSTEFWTSYKKKGKLANSNTMADLVSHPDEIKVVSRRFGQGATNIDRYLELDGYKAVQKALDHGARRRSSTRSRTQRPARTRRRRILHRA